MIVTDTTRRALIIIRDHGEAITYPKYFAALMWPESGAWQRSKKSGYGSAKGAGMYSAAGGYLGKLIKRGLIRESFRGGFDTHARRFELTDAGKEAIGEPGIHE
jgi:hypothetical protein